MAVFEEVVPSPELLMGVKAVWGRTTEPVMCFGGHGDARLKTKGYFSLARNAAETSLQRPYLITIGGGDEVPDDLRGKVLELVRVTAAYGETNAFVQDPDMRVRLSRWPVSVVLSEIYTIDGEPDLVKTLGFPDRTILNFSFDNVRRDEDQVVRLWQALRAREVRRNWDVRPLPGFREPGKVELWGSRYARVSPTSEEGKRLLRLSKEIEADRKLKAAAKAANRERNGGQIVCEACDLCHENASLFDAHHPVPLAAGVRMSRADDLIVLCPTCHRWAHRLGSDILNPLHLPELRTVWGTRTYR